MVSAHALLNTSVRCNDRLILLLQIRGRCYLSCLSPLLFPRHICWLPWADVSSANCCRPSRTMMVHQGEYLVSDFWGKCVHASARFLCHVVSWLTRHLSNHHAKDGIPFQVLPRKRVSNPSRISCKLETNRIKSFTRFFHLQLMSNRVVEPLWTSSNVEDRAKMNICSTWGPHRGGHTGRLSMCQE